MREMCILLIVWSIFDGEGEETASTTAFSELFLRQEQYVRHQRDQHLTTRASQQFLIPASQSQQKQKQKGNCSWHPKNVPDHTRLRITPDVCTPLH